MTKREKWLVYLLRCSDGTLYCGVTNDIEKRLSAHNAGTGAKYTRSRLPVEIVCRSSEMSKSEAFKLEYTVKRSPAALKQKIVTGGNPGKNSRPSSPRKKIEYPYEISAFGIRLLKPGHQRIRQLKRKFKPTNHGHKVWPSFWLLVDYLENTGVTEGSRVLEIGCGWGMSGIYCAKRFRAQVISADSDEAVQPFVAAMADHNGVDVDFRQLDFNSIRRPVLKHVDTVIGSDICFCDTLIDPLRRLVDRAQKAGVRQVIISDPGRWPFEDLCEILLRKKGATLIDWHARSPAATKGQVLTIRF